MLAERQVTYTDAELWRGLPGPGSPPWHNSPFGADGALAQEPGGHLARLSRVLQRTDELGMVVVLGIFYFGQDERLRDEAAVCRAVDETCGWVLQEGWRNVVIEINNECNVPRYEHDILQPHRVHELIARAQRVTHGGDRLLVGTSYGGGRIPDDTVCAASDFILLHGNGVTEPAGIAAMVDQTRALPAWAGEPIAFTEDDHFAFDRRDNNFTAALSRRAGWGFFDPGPGAGGGLAPSNYADGYQNVPVNWAINTPRKRAFFDLLRAGNRSLTPPGSRRLRRRRSSIPAAMTWSENPATSWSCPPSHHTAPGRTPVLPDYPAAGPGRIASCRPTRPK